MCKIIREKNLNTSSLKKGENGRGRRINFDEV